MTRRRFLAPSRPLADRLRERLVESLLSEESDLQLRLNHLALLVAKVPGIVGCVVVVHDDDAMPFAYGASNIELPPDFDPGLLTKHQLAYRPGALLTSLRWEKLLQLPSGISARLLGLSASGQRASASLIVAHWPTPDFFSGLSALQANAALLVVATRTAVRMDAQERQKQLGILALSSNGDATPEEIQQSVGRLRELFRADAASLFLAIDAQEIRLAASTDQNLRQSGVPASYRPGQGLTGYVFEKRQSLRLQDTQDRARVFAATGLNRESPTHPERDLDGATTVQFLAAPLRHGMEAVGVIRLSRKAQRERFTSADETALQYYADLLAGTLGRSWKDRVLESAFDVESEAFAVSRQDRGFKKPHIILLNRGTEKLLGYSAAELAGQDPRKLYSTGEYDRIQGSLHEAAHAGLPEYGPVRTELKRRDGQRVPVEISFRFLTNSYVYPPALYTVALAHDLSASARLTQLLDKMDIAYFRADAAGKTVEPTQTDSRITGYSRAELTSMSRAELWEDPKRREKLIAHAQNVHEPVTRRTIKLKKKNGRSFWAEADFRVLTTPDGVFDGIEGLYRDVTARHQLQTYLAAETDELLNDAQLLHRLQENASFQRAYLVSLGHQLQTPLSSLINNLQNYMGDHQKAVVDRLPYLIGQARVSLRLVRNLSYLDTILQEDAFKMESVSLTKLAIETAIDFEHLEKEKTAKISVDRTTLDQYGQVNGHLELLRQVIVNLVDNAIKYCRPGTTIRIWGAADATLSISSIGLTVPPDSRERIFERGFRTRRAAAAVPHGTGFGLWLVRRILTAHHATIRCLEQRDAPDTQTVFQVHFGQASPPGR